MIERTYLGRCLKWLGFALLGAGAATGARPGPALVEASSPSRPLPGRIVELAHGVRREFMADHGGRTDLECFGRDALPFFARTLAGAGGTSA